jgi:hypothetical protein
MPRAKPLTCHTCGESYVTFLCPRCHPTQGRKKEKGRGGGGGGGGRRAWDYTARALAHPPQTGMGTLSINTDALPDGAGEDEVEGDGDG